MMDGAEARVAALRVMQDVLDGSVRLVGELRRAWPPAEADFLLKRARQEAEHYLITSGELDWLVPTRLGRAVHEAIPGSELYVFTGPHASHCAFLEMTDEFNRVTLDWLRTYALYNQQDQTGH